MSNTCDYCQVNSKYSLASVVEPWRMLVIEVAESSVWFECCNSCYEKGEGEFTNSQTGEILNFKQLYERLK